MSRDLYNIAQEVTDEVMGAGTYASLNKGNPDPGVQRAINQGGTMDEDDERMEMTARLENEITDAARTLVEEYGYSREDIEGILKGTVFSE